eukprot:TRINITY_DN25151_c0_g1_i2.p1 TRINITY_DN25151_c0_g1~~TRINITY_DN25151_c0_g1_i2.p1  ORF type:complete len:886 (+),score=100.14 TRINITY_DN25151_c0_g1_i2:131-2788(+)
MASLDTRQGGLRPTGLGRGRRWDASSSASQSASAALQSSAEAAPARQQRRARQGEAELAESRTSVVGGSDAATAPAAREGYPPPIPEGHHRWAGPGASYPVPGPRAGSYTAEQYASTLPSQSAGSTVTSERGVNPDFASGAKRPRVNVVWHKQSDLRIHDNECLSRAHLERPRLPVVHLHVFDPFWFGKTRLCGFQKTGALRAGFWLECVADVRASLQERGQDLCIRWGMTAGQALKELARSVDIVKVFSYAEVCSEELERDAELDASLSEITRGSGKLVKSWGYTLHHIDDLEACPKPPEKWITPYLSFGAFKQEIKACRVRPVGYEWQTLLGKQEDALSMCPPPSMAKEWWGVLPSLNDLGFTSEDVSEFERSKSNSRVPMQGGESVALARLDEYIWQRRALKQYVGTTDWTSTGKCSAILDQTTKLSAHLAFGCLSPRLLYWEALRFEKSDRCKGVRGMINSLLWRDFYRFISYYAWGNRMYHLYGPTNCGSVPGGHKIPTKWCCKHYNNIFGGSDPRLWTWGRDRAKLRRWTDGSTGYPFVDAAMKELRCTGYLLHLNRETVGWFYVRDLQLDWRYAAEWFESRLVDYDCVLNWGNWVYFVLTQLPARVDDRPGGGPRYTLPRYSLYLMASQVLEWGREHDPTSSYVKTWVPQLKSLPAELAREPWRVSDDALLSFGAGDDSTSGWACTACTLENPLARRACEACGTRRQEFAKPRNDDFSTSPLAQSLGIYADQPIVPPPPDDESLEGVCLQCDHIGSGWSGEDGAFFCASCWSVWAAESLASGASKSEAGADAATAMRSRGAEKPAAASAWLLVPRGALPGHVQGGVSAGAEAEAPAADGQGEAKATEARQGAAQDRRRARWAVKGDRGASLADRLAGA